ncbi:hypothetical protein ABT369_09230 [Dactylosporangium sp. NPDC000244]|uniref:hypothetical protein n=1 Tax=Dactylosporangium sp. NPDC000244 TaxID=3154365 RepID=UPI0033249715
MSMEVIVAAMNAELPRAEWAEAAAKAFTDASGWIWPTVQQLHDRQGKLSPGWTDAAGQEHTAKVGQTLASATGWGERLDAAQVPLALTDVANAIRATHAAVVGEIYPRYLAAIGNPLTWLVAAECVGEAVAAVTALGATQTRAMFQLAASVGQLPADLVSGLGNAAAVQGVTTTAEGNSPEDIIDALDAGVGLADASVGVVQQGLDFAGGLSLAGAHDTTLPTAAALPSLGTSATTGGAPGWPGLAGLGGLGGWGGASGPGGPRTVANPVAGRWAPTLAAEARPGVVAPGAGSASAAGMLPPVTPAMAGQQAAGGTLRPGSRPGVNPGGRPANGRRPAIAADGVPAKLRGRSRRDPAAANDGR